MAYRFRATTHHVPPRQTTGVSPWRRQPACPRPCPAALRGGDPEDAALEAGVFVLADPGSSSFALTPPRRRDRDRGPARSSPGVVIRPCGPSSASGARRRAPPPWGHGAGTSSAGSRAAPLSAAVQACMKAMSKEWRSNPFPLRPRHTGLAEDPCEQPHADVLPMRVWNRQDAIASHHEVVLAPREGTSEPESPEPLDQCPAWRGHHAGISWPSSPSP